MGKNIRNHDSTNIPLQNGNTGCMNKILHALNRRHRWQNVRKVLPNKRQGSGKHIIDGGSSEPTANTGQPPEVHRDPKRNKPKNEQERSESNTMSSKNSKKFRIRSLISDEMVKRRGKHHRRRSLSPSHSPKKKINSVKKTETDHDNGVIEKSPTDVSQSNCESPSTTKKKRKCDICAAMLTVSYLRQKGLTNEHQIEENNDKNQNPSTLEILQVSDGHDTHYLHSHTPLPSRIGLTKSFSFPLLGSSKRRDFEIEELKNKLKDCKDIQTTKEKFILPMNQWKDIGFPKPMLTRPESFRTPSSSSQKEKEQTTRNPKSLKQKIGFVIKDGRKEKRRILMDAVFHKIPYGRRSSKDPKKVGPDKLKSSSTSSSGSDQSSGEKTYLKKNSSTSEAMSKYRRLLSQTSTRDEKMQHSDHKPRLYVAGDHSFGASDRKTHKRIRSLPTISPFEITDNQEFPTKPSRDIDLSMASDLFSEHMSSDHFVLSERRNVLESINHKDEVVDGKLRVGTNISDNQEKFNHQNESNDTIESAVKETNSVDKDEGVHGSLGPGQNTHDCQEQIDHQKETVDENHGEGPNGSNHQENINNQKESRIAIEVEIDKSFNEILGMFKKVSDERVKENQENESSGVVRKGPKNKAVEKDQGVHKNLELGQKTLDHQETDKSPLSPSSEVNQDQSVQNNLEVGHKTLDHNEKDMSPLSSSPEVDKDEGCHKTLQVSQNTLDHEEKENSMLASDCEVEGLMQESIHQSSSLIQAPNSALKGFLNNDKQYLSSINSQPSIDVYRPKNKQAMHIIRSTNDYRMIRKGFLHLDLELLKDNAEFQFVKEVLEKSGFLENELIGEWYSSYQPIDPLLFEEVETSFLQNKILEELDDMKDEEAAQKIINDHHLLLFDLINVALLEIHSKTYTYCPHPLIYRSKVRPMPVGCRLLEEVWDVVNMYLSWNPELQPSLDDVLSRDLAKGDGWMNLQADAEFVGIELEELITDDLLDELVFDDLLM